MADQDQCISLVNARVIIEPGDQPERAEEIKIAQAQTQSFKRMERAADRVMKTVIILFVTYMLLEVLRACASGAFTVGVR